MGRTRHILLEQIVRNDLSDRRFTVELCENIHVHYRNLRLEFSKEEFLALLGLLKGLNPDEVANFQYGSYTF
jgi:hypothetical protein